MTEWVYNKILKLDAMLGDNAIADNTVIDNTIIDEFDDCIFDDDRINDEFDHYICMNKRLEFDKSKFTIGEIISGLSIILDKYHNLGIIHCDIYEHRLGMMKIGDKYVITLSISPDSIILDECDEHDKFRYNGCNYVIPPENYTTGLCYESDWWGLGCLIYKLVTGDHLVNADPYSHMTDPFDYTSINTKLDKLQTPHKEFIQKCLRICP